MGVSYREIETMLRESIQREFGGDVGICVDAVSLKRNDALHPLEARSIAEAGFRRRASFCSGRACARAALRQLGDFPGPIVVGNGGEPCWPTGITGSISHTDQIVGAIVSRNQKIQGLGFDIEDDTPLDGPEMLHLVCRPDELMPRFDTDYALSLKRGKLIFVAKEAVYKACNPSTGVFMDFFDLKISIDDAFGTFSVETEHPFISTIVRQQSLSGYYWNILGFVIAIAVLRTE